MFRGCNLLSVDDKGRLAIPSRYRERLGACAEGALVLTVSPKDRALWLYPLPIWEQVERKLTGLPDFDRACRRLKQMMCGYATDCPWDAQGRFLIPPPLREFIGLGRQAAFLGMGNKFEIWSVDRWEQVQEQWLQSVESADEAPSPLRELTL